MNERIEQIKIYIGKHFRLFKTEKGWKILIFAAIISFLVSFVLQGTMFVDTLNTQMGFFTLVSACIWIGIFNSIQSICKERDIIKREHRTGLHISSYVISHMIYQSLICIVETLILLGISSFLLKYPTDKSLVISVYIEYFITFFLITYAADILALAISAIVRSTTTAMTVMPFILIIQLLFAGVIFPLEGPMETVAKFTISKWGLNATSISCDYNNLENFQMRETRWQLNQIAKSKKAPLTDKQVEELVEEAYSDVDYTVADYEYSTLNLLKQWGIFILHILAYGAICILFLEFIDKDKR